MSCHGRHTNSTYLLNVNVFIVAYITYYVYHRVRPSVLQDWQRAFGWFIPAHCENLEALYMRASSSFEGMRRRFMQ